MVELLARPLSSADLNTVRGSAAEQLYTSSGWERAGVIPGYALDPDGRTLCDTVVFYKTLR